MKGTRVLRVEALLGFLSVVCTSGCPKIPWRLSVVKLFGEHHTRGVRRLLRIRCHDLLITNPQPWGRVYGLQL